MLENIKIEKKYYYTFFSTFLAGTLAHNFLMSNKISFHDDICSLFGIGSTYKLGRWGLGIILSLVENTIGKYSIPFWEIMCSLLFIALTACIVVNLLEIEKEINCVLFAAIMAVFPAAAVTFMYTFTAGSYFLGLFLAVLAVWLTERKKFGWIGAIICIAFSLGIYQAYLSVAITISILIIMKKCMDEKVREVVESIIKSGVIYGGGLLCYFAMVKLSLKLTGSQLSGYMGTDTMMDLSIATRIRRMRYCYSDMIKMLHEDIVGLTNNFVIRLLVIIILATLICAVAYYFTRITHIGLKAIYIGLFIALPIGINLVYPMTSPETEPHAIMRYSLVCIWIAASFFVGRIKIDSWQKKCIHYAVLISCLGSILFYAYYDNAAYLKANFMQEQTSSYYTTLITQIKSCDGYKDELPVVYIGKGKIEDLTLSKNDKYDIDLTLFNCDLNEWINDFAYVAYMEHHNGFAPEIIKPEEITEWEEIDKMPIYPDDGSIKVINNKVVVKFAERE
ncbi:MAG: glucosyltransferase domain-containing protein [Lachnospiraceae bacterium]|nr:glucosyltransferase domain-containing protein [Lachnospiraceae bacterium]